MRKTQASPKAASKSYITPDAVYPLRVFETLSGISPTRRWQARQEGIELKTFSIGRLKFVRGCDAINYMVELAAAAERQTED